MNIFKGLVAIELSICTHMTGCSETTVVATGIFNYNYEWVVSMILTMMWHVIVMYKDEPVFK